ncbi:MAG: glycosyltransferase family 39 protein [Chloroflexi bacterium]|nr:glycosyltransferase family 39 protein [Chloroflexota bacterium]
MTNVATLARQRPAPPAAPPAARANRLRTLASLPLLALALVFAVLGQRLLAERMLPLDPVILYLVALGLWFRALAFARPAWTAPAFWRAVPAAAPLRLASRAHFPLALGFAVLAWLLLDGDSFTRGGVVAWVGSLIFLARAVLRPPQAALRRLREAAARFVVEGWRPRISAEALLLVGVLLVAAFFRLYQLPSVPGELTSDPIEKLLDVRDVLQGKAPLFFARNAGREPIQFYLAAALTGLTGLTYLTLQLVMVAASLLAVLATYFLGRELLSARFGLLAALLMAVSRWDITLARSGLRLSLGPLFAALTLLFLFRAMRTQRLSQYLLSGLCLGLGVLGYSNMRVMPVLVVVLWLLGRKLRGGPVAESWRGALLGLGVLASAAALVALPLARYVAAHPDMFLYRALTRAGTLERPFPDDPLLIFLDNVKNALLMFNWRGDIGWYLNVNQTPALDAATGALFALGVAYLVVRLVREREFWVAALLASVPVLLLATALSLAFPQENPSFNRAGTAIPVVYVIAALAPGLVWDLVRRVLPGWKGGLVAAAVLAALLVSAAVQNFTLYFGDYARNYRQSAPNSSEMAAVAAGFAQAVGGRERVFLLSYPHWVDHRAVGLHMGDLGWNNLVAQPEQVAQQRALPGSKVYLVNQADTRGIDELRRVYPTGLLLRHSSPVPGRDFLIYLVIEQAR